MAQRERGRRFPVGAEVMPDGRTEVRVWAPARKQVAVAHGPALRARARLPQTFRPQQLRVIGTRPISSDVMMIKPLVPGAKVPASHVYWQLDVF